MPASANRAMPDSQEARVISMTEPPRPSLPATAIGHERRTPGIRQGRRVAGARRVNRLLAAMASSRRFDELLAEARYANRHNLYRTTGKPPQ